MEKSLNHGNVNSFRRKLDDIPENKGIKAMKAANQIAEENRLSDISLDEINAEIAETRK